MPTILVGGIFNLQSFPSKTHHYLDLSQTISFFLYFVLPLLLSVSLGFSAVVDEAKGFKWVSYFNRNRGCLISKWISLLGLKWVGSSKL